MSTTEQDPDRPRYTLDDFKRRWTDVTARSDRLYGYSIADRLAICELARPGFLDHLVGLMKPHEWLRLVYTTRFWARPKQVPPEGDWLVWFNCGGRGAGKTWTGSRFAIDRIEQGEARTIAFVGENIDKVKEIMFGGRKKLADGANGSGLLDQLPPWAEVNYRADEAVAEIKIGQHEATVRGVTAVKSEWRGPNTDTVIGEEMITWPRPHVLLDNMLMTIRDKRGIVGEPRVLLGSTPKNMPFLRDLVMQEDCVTIRHHQDDNRTNLSEKFIRKMRARYDGTRRGEEERAGNLLGDTPGALFSLITIQNYRTWEPPSSFADGLVSVDPGISEQSYSDPTGIVAVGRTGTRTKGELFPLEAIEGVFPPEVWAQKTIALATKYGFDILVETNRGGNLVKRNIEAALYGKSRGVKLREVHNTKAEGSKWDRAEPLSVLYKHGHVHHVGVNEGLRELEDTITTWVPSDTKSPNLLDALSNAAANLLDLEEVLSGEEAIDEAAKANAILDAASSGNLTGTLLGGRLTGGGIFGTGRLTGGGSGPGRSFF